MGEGPLSERPSTPCHNNAALPRTACEFPREAEAPGRAADQRASLKLTTQGAEVSRGRRRAGEAEPLSTLEHPPRLGGSVSPSC